MVSLLRKHPVAWYIAIAYAISGGLWIVSQTMAAKGGFPVLGGMASWPAGGMLDNPARLVATVLYGLAAYGPLAAALVVSAARGQGGARGLLRRSFNLRLAPKWYLLVLAVAVGINVPAVLAVWAGGSWQIAAPAYTAGAVATLFASQLLTSGLEEPGWRGFLLPELFRRFDAEKATWFCGLVWAVWHYPMVVPLYWQMGLVPLVWSLVGFTMAICGAAFIYAWMYLRTQSVWLAIVLHAAMNTAQIVMIGTTQNPAAAILPALTTWGIAWALQTYWPARPRRAAA